jgi:hypothetical protein
MQLMLLNKLKHVLFVLSPIVKTSLEDYFFKRFLLKLIILIFSSLFKSQTLSNTISFGNTIRIVISSCQISSNHRKRLPQAVGHRCQPASWDLTKSKCFMKNSFTI